jgi:hypothetical protein
MITDEQMRAAAAAIADEARENYGGVDVISVGPAVSALYRSLQIRLVAPENRPAKHEPGRGIELLPRSYALAAHDRELRRLVLLYMSNFCCLPGWTRFGVG